MRARSSWCLAVVVAAAGGTAACGDDGGAGPAGDGGVADAAVDAPLGTIVEPGDPGAADVRVDVRVDTARAPISPLIYGVNGGADPARDRPGLQRSGGNRLTAYNWENNASNAGADYCNQNDATFGGPGSPPAGAYRALLDDARARGTAALVTVPIIDHVAADHDDLGDGGQGPPACVGDVRNSGADYLQTRFVANAPRRGSAFPATPDLGDGVVYQDEAVAYLRRTWGDVRVLVALDNEPDLWSSTHPRVHPAPVTYAELADRTLRFAAAVKDAWPDAPVLGFVSYGYNGYTTLQNAPDGAGRPFIPFFLDQLHAADAAAGHRLVDVLDLHWYPEARGDGVRISDTSGAQGAAARVQAPRSLWDPSYREDSWIVNDVLHAPIALLPSLAADVAAHDPGIGLGFSEWNYGGGNDVSGAIATADVLGIFGREHVTLSSIWLLRAASQERYTLAGLRVYTSYDGAGAHFGDTSIAATTTDVARVTAYASDEGTGARQVVVLINKATTPLTAAVTIATPHTLTAADRWVLDGDAPSIDPAAAVTPTATNAFRVDLPASSITILAPR
ncbi:MAG TPA: glycoside hydrolase family 44 protein [Kofleriaceae bacterium]|nr:glycoside hydrolase family 44 protein [Kofleriaceae bacterium]